MLKSSRGSEPISIRDTPGNSPRPPGAGNQASWRTRLVLAAFLASSAGCATAPPPSTSGPHILSYTLVKVENSIDPKTGYLIRTAHWRYEDGVTTTTEDTTVPGGDIERRRHNNPPNPEPRVGD
jgi:hypothetical protein